MNNEKRIIQTKNPPTFVNGFSFGAVNRIRTGDLVLTKDTPVCMQTVWVLLPLNKRLSDLLHFLLVLSNCILFPKGSITLNLFMKQDV